MTLGPAVTPYWCEYHILHDSLMLMQYLTWTILMSFAVVEAYEMNDKCTLIPIAITVRFALLLTTNPLQKSGSNTRV